MYISAMQNKKHILGCLIALVIFGLISCAPHWKGTPATPAPELVEEQAAYPEHIILTWKDDPATTQAVSWRTDSSVSEAFAEIAISDPSPDFRNHAAKYKVRTRQLDTENGLKLYHSVNFNNLKPDTLYAYRVGASETWSEWFHFRTAADQTDDFSFIYFGDAQNEIRSMWSRVIRAAYAYAPEARFMLHAGDLVDKAESDKQWSEWFQAGGWIHAMVPGIPIIGNHEYNRDKKTKKRWISKYWKMQFMLPENGIEHLGETNYFIDYQGVRIIALNSIEKLAEQAQWLEKIVEDNPGNWTIVAFHHPIYSAAKRRDNTELRSMWKPLFDRCKVDLVLQGHDHTYARGFASNSESSQSGPMYVISVSGPKMYKQSSHRWMKRKAQNTQMFQVVRVKENRLRLEAVAVTGEVVDAFDLVRQDDGSNALEEG